MLVVIVMVVVAVFAKERREMHVPMMDMTFLRISTIRPVDMRHRLHEHAERDQD